MARQVSTVAGLIRKIRKFYETHWWGRGALYTRNGAWCLLGAASAVLTNEERIKAEGKDVLGVEQSDFKGVDLIKSFKRFVKENGEYDGHTGRGVTTLNDGYFTSRRDMLNFLANLERAARKAKV